MWLAGGGVKGGFRYGATDDYGYYAVEDKVHIHDLHATILHLLGLDHEKLTYRYAGRDFRLTDVARRGRPRHPGVGHAAPPVRRPHRAGSRDERRVSRSDEVVSRWSEKPSWPRTGDRRHLTPTRRRVVAFKHHREDVQFLEKTRHCVTMHTWPGDPPPWEQTSRNGPTDAK